MWIEACLLGFGGLVLVVLMVLGYRDSRERKDAERQMLQALRGTPEWAGDEYDEQPKDVLTFKAVMRDKK